MNATVISLNDMTVVLENFNNLYEHIKRLFFVHYRDNIKDYFKMKSLINELYNEIVNINKKNRVFKTVQEYESVYRDVNKFIIYGETLDLFIVKLNKLQKNKNIF